MKTVITVTVTMHLYESDAPPLSSFGNGTADSAEVATEYVRRVTNADPLTLSRSAKRDVTDREDGLRLLKSFDGHVQSAFTALSCEPHTGHHVLDFAFAKGGTPLASRARPTAGMIRAVQTSAVKRNGHKGKNGVK